MKRITVAPKLVSLKLMRFSLSVMVALGAAIATATVGSANDSQVNPLEGLSTGRDGGDSVFDNPNGQSGFYELIHNYQLGPRRSVNDYITDQQGTFNSEVESFRAQQRARIQGQQNAGNTGIELQAP